MARKRQPRGTTTGGQFAAESKSETDVSLADQRWDSSADRPDAQTYAFPRWRDRSVALTAYDHDKGTATIGDDLHITCASYSDAFSRWIDRDSTTLGSLRALGVRGDAQLHLEGGNFAYDRWSCTITTPEGVEVKVSADDRRDTAYVVSSGSGFEMDTSALYSLGADRSQRDVSRADIAADTARRGLALSSQVAAISQTVASRINDYAQSEGKRLEYYARREPIRPSVYAAPGQVVLNLTSSDTSITLDRETGEIVRVSQYDRRTDTRTETTVDDMEVWAKAGYRIGIGRSKKSVQVLRDAFLEASRGWNDPENFTVFSQHEPPSLHPSKEQDQ